jgi:hypothetical protein
MQVRGAPEKPAWILNVLGDLLKLMESRITFDLLRPDFHISQPYTMETAEQYDLNLHSSLCS